MRRSVTLLAGPAVCLLGRLRIAGVRVLVAFLKLPWPAFPPVDASSFPAGIKLGR
jgi:hypothetical protein